MLIHIDQEDKPIILRLDRFRWLKITLHKKMKRNALPPPELYIAKKLKTSYCFPRKKENLMSILPIDLNTALTNRNEARTRWDNAFQQSYIAFADMLSDAIVKRMLTAFKTAVEDTLGNEITKDHKIYSIHSINFINPDKIKELTKLLEEQSLPPPFDTWMRLNPKEEKSASRDKEYFGQRAEIIGLIAVEKIQGILTQYQNENKMADLRFEVKWNGKNGDFGSSFGYSHTIATSIWLEKRFYGAKNETPAEVINVHAIEQKKIERSNIRTTALIACSIVAVIGALFQQGVLTFQFQKNSNH